MPEHEKEWQRVWLESLGRHAKRIAVVVALAFLSHGGLWQRRYSLHQIAQIIYLASFMHSAPDIATAVYWTGIDPFTKQEVYVAKGLKDRKMQRALMQFFKPSNYFTVREALIEAKRTDLIGSGCDCLIPSQPPREALEARRKQANAAVQGDHYHTVANPAKGEAPGERGAEPQKSKGYRPGRKTQERRPRKNNGNKG